MCVVDSGLLVCSVDGHCTMVSCNPYDSSCRFNAQIAKQRAVQIQTRGVFTEDVCYNSYVMQYYKRDRDYVVFGTDDGFVYIYGLQKNHLVSPSLSLECSPSWVVRTWTVPLSTSLQSRSPHPSCSSFPVREALPMRWSSCTGRYGQRKSDPKCAIASDMSITTPMCIPAAQATQSSAVVREY